MKRDPARLADGEFDLLVVGAGIQGACVADEATLAGLRVALIDSGDFGAATSHNSFKLIHAGFRYLQHVDLPRIRQSVAATRGWFRDAPGLVRPMPFLMPTYGHGTRGREALFLALQAYSLLSADRNRGVPASARIPRGRMLSRAEVLDRVPGIPDAGLTGGAMWYDGQLQDADRLLLRVVRRAVRSGACAANHVEAVGLRRSAAGISGVVARDGLNGAEFEIRARTTVLCCGPWTTGFLAAVGAGAPPSLARGLVKGINVVVRRRPLDFGLGVASRTKSDAAIGETRRLHFVTPWHDCSVLGTTHEAHAGPPEDFAITDDDVSRFLAEVDDAYPALGLTPDDAVYCYGGLTPGNESADAANMRSRKSAVVDHGQSDGLSGLVSVVGVKWTTARELARATVAQLRASFPDANPVAAFASLLDQDEYERAGQGELPGGLAGAAATAVEGEMAVRLGDLVLRRSTLAARGLLDAPAIEAAAREMAARLGWSAERVQLEHALTRGELVSHRCMLRGGDAAGPTDVVS